MTFGAVMLVNSADLIHQNNIQCEKKTEETVIHIVLNYKEPPLENSNFLNFLPWPYNILITVSVTLSSVCMKRTLASKVFY